MTTGTIRWSFIEVRLGSFTQLLFKFVFADSTALHLDVQVYTWGCGEAKRMCDLLQVELVDIEDLPLLVRGVRLQVGPVAVFGRAVQVVVSLDELHELFLHVGELVLGELVLIRLDF